MLGAPASSAACSPCSPSTFVSPGAATVSASRLCAQVRRVSRREPPRTVAPAARREGARRAGVLSVPPIIPVSAAPSLAPPAQQQPIARVSRSRGGIPRTCAKPRAAKEKDQQEERDQEDRESPPPAHTEKRSASVLMELDVEALTETSGCFWRHTVWISYCCHASICNFFWRRVCRVREQSENKAGQCRPYVDQCIKLCEFCFQRN